MWCSCCERDARLLPPPRRGSASFPIVPNANRQHLPRQRQGKAEDDIAKAAKLFEEISQQIDAKQLKPFIRTQYMRSAFQARSPCPQ